MTLVVEALCQALESAFALTLTQAEKFEIYVLLKMNANHHMKAQINELAKMVNDDTFSIANKIIKEVDQHYFVNLMSDSFMTPFVLHLKHLRNRLHLHSSIKNPMLESIKISCPTIYDISTFMAYQLMQEFHEEINEDEIAFLALHVGTEIERQNKAETKATCILLCPEYLGISTHLYNKILLDFGEQLNIKKLISFENELQQETFDILITTLPVSRSGNYVTVQLPPFPMNYEKNKILEAVTRIEKIKKGKLLADNIDLYFNQNLFYLKQGDADKNTIITELADQMITLGYVGDDFKDEVWKREKASSTAFMNIAIPHPMKMSAYKSSIAVAISPKGIEWKEHHLVNVVFMIAFNMIDNKQFHSLYESLILLFNEPNVITEIKKCKSFKDFKQIIIRNYMKIIE